MFMVDLHYTYYIYGEYICGEYMFATLLIVTWCMHTALTVLRTYLPYGTAYLHCIGNPAEC